MTYTAMELAEAYLETGELNLALAALNDHLNAFPADDSARRLRVQVLRGFPDGIALALADLDALTAPDASDDGVRGAILAAQGDWIGAAAAYERAWVRSPVGYGEAYFRVLKRIGDVERALTVLETLPKAWHWHQARAELDALRGDDAAAVEQFSAAIHGLHRLIAVAKDRRLLVALLANALLARASALRRLTRYADAESDYADAHVYEPGDAAIPFNRGLMCLERGAVADAIRLCREGWEGANPAMRAAMRAELSADPRYQPLLAALLALP